MELVELGKVVKLHGYLGLMKIVTKYDKDFDIRKIDKLYDKNGNEFVVNRIFSNTDAVVVGLENVDLEKAKGYVGSNFYVDRGLFGDKILFEDLKGSEIYFEDQSKLGKIVDVQDYGTAEVISVVTEKGLDLMFPNVDGVISSFDYKQKKLVINKSKFKEVADYED